jgi:hypothetical protein
VQRVSSPRLKQIERGYEHVGIIAPVTFPGSEPCPSCPPAAGALCLCGAKSMVKKTTQAVDNGYPRPNRISQILPDFALNWESSWTGRGCWPFRSLHGVQLMALNEYWRRAVQCLCIADENTTSAESRMSLVGMVQAWLKLAQGLEQNPSAEILWQTTSPPVALPLNRLRLCRRFGLSSVSCPEPISPSVISPASCTCCEINAHAGLSQTECAAPARSVQPDLP